MSDELQAAAERRRRIASGERSDQAYRAFSAPTMQQFKDMSMLAEAYLAEHPADDAEPITGEWLVQAGFTFVDAKHPYSPGWVLSLVDFEIDEERGIYGEEMRLISGGESGIWHVEVRSKAECWSEGVGLAGYRTRGELQLFLRSIKRPIETQGSVG